MINYMEFSFFYLIGKHSSFFCDHLQYENRRIKMMLRT